MVAAVQIESSDDEVQHILREHPEILPFIRRVTQVSDSFYPGSEVALEGAQYEDDPPLVLTVKVVRRVDDFVDATDRFARWLGKQPDYDFGLISVAPLPAWGRPS